MYNINRNDRQTHDVEYRKKSEHFPIKYYTNSLKNSIVLLESVCV